MPRPRTFLMLALLAGLLSGLFLWLRPGPAPPRPEGPAIAVLAPTITRFDEGGRRLWELEAEVITLEREANRAVAESVRLRFFRDGEGHATGQEEVALNAMATRLSLYGSGEMELEGGIEARDDRGLEFRTERARWDPQRGLLSGDLEVEIMRGEERLLGRGFEYSPGEGRLIVHEAELILVPGGG